MRNPALTGQSNRTKFIPQRSKVSRDDYSRSVLIRWNRLGFSHVTRVSIRKIGERRTANTLCWTRLSIRGDRCAVPCCTVVCINLAGQKQAQVQSEREIVQTSASWADRNHGKYTAPRWLRIICFRMTEGTSGYQTAHGRKEERDGRQCISMNSCDGLILCHCYRHGTRLAIFHRCLLIRMMFTERM